MLWRAFGATSLTRIRNRDPAVSFPTASLLKPPSIHVDHQKMALLRLEWEQHVFTPLPLHDDDDYALVRGQQIEHGRSVNPSESQRLSTISASDTAAQFIAKSPNLNSQTHHATSLISNREQHISDIHLGQLKNIKNILAESVAALLRDEQVSTKHEAGDTIDGYGIRVYSDGTLYAGDFLRGNRDGVGILRWGNGHTYYGSWVDDVAHGQGRYRFPNGDSYTGEWDSGSVIGEGSFTHEDGQVFDGEHRLCIFLFGRLYLFRSAGTKPYSKNKKRVVNSRITT